ncbi:hypothetical protein Y022_02990 [Streptococcus thermophilus TH1477]|nr:hypothetical protein Y022_02990 [Streptococcus thermophilus TH1477]
MVEGKQKRHLDKVNPQGWTEKSNFGGFIYE